MPLGGNFSPVLLRGLVQEGEFPPRFFFSFGALCWEKVIVVRFESRVVRFPPLYIVVRLARLENPRVEWLKVQRSWIAIIHTLCWTFGPTVTITLERRRHHHGWCPSLAKLAALSHYPRIKARGKYRKTFSSHAIQLLIQAFDIDTLCPTAHSFSAFLQQNLPSGVLLNRHEGHSGWLSASSDGRDRWTSVGLCAIVAPLEPGECHNIRRLLLRGCEIAIFCEVL